jgi:hypothetical protein
MKENKRKNIHDILGIKIDKKEVKQSEDDFLLSIIERLCEVEAIVQASSQIGINLFELEERYLTLIKDIFQKHYGEEITELIFWWVFESILPTGDILPIIDKDDKEHFIKTPKQLLKFLKKYKNA